MLKNYLKIAYRHFVRNKLFSFINLFGLAIGLSICMIISLWVQRESSYDRFHANAQRIYRIERELFRDNVYSRWPIVGGQYKQALIDDYPEIENATRVWRRLITIKDHNNFTHRQDLFAVDNAIFDIFDFGLVAGDEQTALTKPMTVVLTRENALKYFDTEDVIGKQLPFEFGGEPMDFEVTGILKEVPENSHIHFDMLMSISSYPEDEFTGWRSNYLYTYVLVQEGTSRLDLEGKLKSFVTRHLESHYGDLLAQGFGIHEVLKMHLFPITSIHLHPSENWEIEAGGNMASVYIFSLVALLILIIACINFVNLSTARSSKRALEVSLRKTVGAGQMQLRGQFIQESMLLAFLALLLALVLDMLLIPAYEQIFHESLSLSYLFQIKNMGILIGTTLIVGFLAGIYPAFQLTRYKPLDILRGTSLSGKGRSGFKRNMVIIQFGISIALIIGMFTVYRQMQYIQNRSLGFEKENIVLVSVQSQQMAQNYEAYRTELLKYPQVLSVARSSDVPGETFFSNTNFHTRLNPEDPFSLIILGTDYDFVETYRIEVQKGRTFSRDFGSDTSGALMLNEAAVRRIGWKSDEAVGKELVYSRGDVGRVVGVVKNFHLKSMHTIVEPMALILNLEWINTISVRVKPDDMRESLAYLRSTWESTFPGEQFEFSFLDERIQQLYERERKMQNIFIIFSVLSIFVASLGILGLAAFMAEVKTKEIGIRKVLGASTSSVTLLLSSALLRWIVLANLVAWPVTWYVMNKWLQNFAYRIDISVGSFLLASALALIIALLTVSWQTIRAAHANPVESLKYE